MKITYRPEIDGMRAIAVTAVLIYHLKMSFGGSVFLPGGFLGVDLFFVLSGFLITSILLRELISEGKISFTNFYARRARRILPPLLMVMVVSIPFAWAILLPSEFTKLGMSFLATLGFASNFFWYFELGTYGAQSGLLQPFLHTWSLAIEEQFYVVFPLVLLGLARFGGQRAIGFAIAILIFVSLAFAHMSSIHQPDQSFFSPLSRAWELMAGSGLAFLATKRPDFLRAGRAARFVPVGAILIILGYFLAFDLHKAIHPGLPILPFIVASCALLWFVRPGEPVTNILSTRPFVFVGKLSYSIYLWHFPVFAFGRLSIVDGVTAADRLVWLGVTFALSVAGNYLIERPFRFRLPTRPFVVTFQSSSSPSDFLPNCHATRMC